MIKLNRFTFVKIDLTQTIQRHTSNYVLSHVVRVIVP